MADQGVRPPQCVGCGYCCMKVPCGPSLAKFGRLDCPVLVWNGERYICGMADEWQDQLAIGEGCCMNMNSWRGDVRERDSRTGVQKKG